MRDENSSKLYIEHAEDRIEKTCLDRQGSALMDCIHQEITSAQEYNRAERDLEAQKSMALWAKMMTFVTGFGTVVGVGGIYLVWRTLKASESATQAALEAVKVTEKIGRAQTRAYVALKSADIQFGEKEIRIDYAFANSGQSPAYNVAIKSMWAAEYGHFDSEWHKEIVDGSSVGTIDPGGEVQNQMITSERSKPDRQLSPDQIIEVAHAKRNFWVYGRITYFDIFGEAQTTIFRLILNYRNEKFVLGFCDEGNEST